jgi:hypothetical protein
MCGSILGVHPKPNQSVKIWQSFGPPGKAPCNKREQMFGGWLKVLQLLTTVVNDDASSLIWLYRPAPKMEKQLDTWWDQGRRQKAH